MANDITVYGFETSNNMKVRVGLGYKGLDYRFETVDPKDRAHILELSGQHLTPVLTHGDRVLFDSPSILRYLDVTFPDTPKLFGHSHRQQWEIEDWELFARAQLAGPLMQVVHRRTYGEAVEDTLLQECSDNFTTAVQQLAVHMQGRRWLVGETMTAADIHAATVMFRIRKAGMFDMPAAAGPLLNWEDSVMAYDGKHRVAG